MTLLAIDTSTRVCALGVRHGTQTWVDETDLGRTHSQEILPRIEALLNRADVARSALDGIVFGQGPGSFTGLRIGIGVVQGLAYGLGVPVVGISSLACLAQQFLKAEGESALVALAARNTEVYFGAYEKVAAGVRLIGQEGVFEALEIPSQDPAGKWIGVGDGWQLRDQLLQASGVTLQGEYLEPRITASDLLDLGQLDFDRGLEKSAFDALPEYLREQVATAPSGKKV